MSALTTAALAPQAYLEDGDCQAVLDELDWTAIAAQLDSEGCALLPRMLAPEHARELAHQADTLNFLSSVTAEIVDCGAGEVLHFGSSLPAPWSVWRTAFYRKLAPLANRWNETLGESYRFPAGLDAFLRRNRDAGHTQQLSHLNRLRTGDFMALHQSNAGEHVFPFQLVALLTEPGKDFQGGEFVLTEQRPRMQSRPMVVPLKLGDMAIIGTAQRPFRGAGGYYRVNLRHAISRVRGGERVGVELSFHDAP
jgi:uncharacterized protein